MGFAIWNLELNAGLQRSGFAAGCVVIMLSAFLCGCDSQKSDDAAEDAEICYELANAHSEAGRYAEAIAAYKKAVALNPDYADAYHGLGLAYLMVGQDTDAIAACKKAIALKPYCAESYGNMGRAYYELGQYAEAIVAFKKTIAIKPDYSFVYCAMGATYEKLKQNTLAIAAYEEFIAIEPKGESADLAREAIRRLRER